MANLTKSADVLIAEVKDSVKQELFAAIEPIARKIIAAVSELQNALGSAQGKPAAAVVPVVRRGRRPGRPVGSKSAAKVVKAAKKMAGAPKKAGRAKRSPRGALQAHIVAVLQKSGAPLNLAGLRDEILRTSEFKGRDGKTIYTQIAQAIKRIPNVDRTGKGTYRLK